MGMIGDLLTGRLRQEMKERVGEILKCGNEWNRTARELIESLDKLTDSIQKGNPDPAISRSVARGTKKLAKETVRLTRALEVLTKTLAEITGKFGL